LICPYHGWRFGPDTQCEQMPAHPATTPAKAARARAFAAREADGFVWMSMDMPADTPAVNAGSAGSAGALAAQVPLRTITVAGDLARAAAGWLCQPLAASARGSWRDWRWSRSGGDLHVEAIRGDETYRAALRVGGTMDCVHVRAAEVLGYGFDLVDSAPGSVTVHLTVAADTSAAVRTALMTEFAAARRWLATHPADAAWADATIEARRTLPAPVKERP